MGKTSRSQQQRATVWKRMCEAVRNLWSMGERELFLFCRLFGLKMNEARKAVRKVVHFYTKNDHPWQSNSWVPSELVEAMALLGRRKFIQAKLAGERLKVRGIKYTYIVEEVVKQTIQKIFPPQRTAVRRRRNYSLYERVSEDRFLSRLCYRRHPYMSIGTAC